MRPPVKSPAADRIAKRASTAIVRERIHYTRYALDQNARSLLALHLRLSAVLSSRDWDYIDKATFAQEQLLRRKATQKQTNKYDRLSTPKSTTTPLDQDRIVINLLGEDIDKDTKSVLAKGLNFAPAPRTINYSNYIGAVEPAIRSLPQEISEEVRSQIALVLKKATPPKTNISKGERDALQRLKDNPNIVVLPADKGNATVLLKLEAYHEKIRLILDDPAFLRIQRDPTASIVRKTSSLLKMSGLPPDTCRSLLPQAPVPPRLYGLPKIHKIGVPLRPIVSAINSPTYLLAKFLSKQLSPFVGRNERHLKNSTEFVNKIKSIKIGPKDLMVSFDVVSLFTRVPIKDTLIMLEEHFDKKLIDLFRHTLNSTYFLYKGEYYKQTDGVAMGSPLSPAIANFFMERFEEEALNTAPWKPLYYFRYVDDTFAIWPHGEEKLHQFLEHLNSRHPNIRFTCEMEENGQLPFLDVLLRRHPDGTLGHSVYRKPTHTDLYLNGGSHHHPAQLNSVIKTLIHRAYSVSDRESLPEELKHLRTTFLQNGYPLRDVNRALKRAACGATNKTPEEKPTATAYLPYTAPVSRVIARILGRHNIKTVHLPPRKLGTHLTRIKDQLGLRTPGVYRVPCECGATYIGETGRAIDTRISEHSRCIRLKQPDRSAIAEHALENGHKISFKETKVLWKAPSFWERKTKEAIEIYLEDNNLNRDKGIGLNNAWKPILRKIAQNRIATNRRSERDTNPSDI